MIKKKNIIITFLVFIILCSLFSIKGLALRLTAQSDDNPLDAFEYKEVSANYSGKQNGFIYNDGMLLTDATVFSEDIAKIGVALAVSAYSKTDIQNAINNMWSENEKTFESYNYDKDATLYDNDFVAYSIVSRTVEYKGEKYIEYVVPIRGTPKSAEWFSDFNLGTTGNHEGFYKAANEVLSSISTHVAKDGKDAEHRIFLITGHSRGAAVANIVAGSLTDKQLYAKANHIFGYTFACPAVSKNANETYTNIQNFNTEGDFIPEMPLSDWGYKRYGKTNILNSGDKLFYNNFLQRFKTVTGNDYAGLTSTESYLNVVNQIILRESDYYNPEIRAVTMLAAYFLGGNKDATLAETLSYAGYDVTENIISDVSSIMNIANLKISLESMIKEYEEYVAFLNDALEKTITLTDEQFQEFLIENDKMISKIEEVQNFNIENRYDLQVAVSGLNLIIEDAYGLGKVAGNALVLLFDANGNPAASVTDAHTTEAYVLWINSLYYGYNGWVNNQEITALNLPQTYSNIGSNCFSNNTNLTTLVIPKNIAYVGTGAFNSCTNLKKISIPVDYDWNKITLNRFNGVPVEKIRYTYGNSGIMTDRTNSSNDANNYEKTLEWNTRNTLKNVEFDEGITHVGDYAFYVYHRYTYEYGGHLENVKLPESLETIGRHAFSYQDDLQSIVIPDNVKELGELCFSNSTGLINVVMSKNVTKIPDSCFENCVNLIELPITSNIESIGSYAFNNCDSLTKIEIPKETKSIGSYAFYNCSGLKEVVMPVDYDYGKETPFLNIPVEKIRYTYGNSGIMTDRTNSSNDANNYEKTLEWNTRSTLKNVEFDEGITHVGDYAFYVYHRYTYEYGGHLENVKLPESLETIGRHAFSYQDDLQSIVIPDNVRELGELCFSNSTGLINVVMSKNVTKIPDSCFENCVNLIELPITSNIESIGSYAFNNCDSLTKIEIPKETKSIGSYAFYNCSGLKEVVMPVDYDYGKETPFLNIPVEKIRYTYGNSGIMTDRTNSSNDANNYEKTLEWNTRSTLKNVEFDEGITHVGDYAFYVYHRYTYEYGGHLENVKLPESLETIGRHAFSYQDDLQSIVIPDNVKELGELCFSNSTGLINVVMSKNVTKIPDSCFENCVNLIELPITSNIENIGSYAFNNCDSLTKIEIPKETKSIGSYAFYNCSGLKEVVMPVDYDYGKETPFLNIPVEKIRYTYGNSGIMTDRTNSSNDANNYEKTLEWNTRSTLKNVEFDEGITHVGDYAFYVYHRYTYEYGGHLENVKLPESLETIGRHAFSYQDDLQSIVIPDNVRELGEYCFANDKGLNDILFGNDYVVIPNTLFNNVDNTKLTVYGNVNSNAQIFAENNDIRFITLNYPIIENEYNQLILGNNYQCRSYVYTGINQFSEDVLWSIEGHTSENTFISNDGVLTLGLDEKASSVTLLASYGNNTASIVLELRVPFKAIFKGAISTIYYENIHNQINKPAEFEQSGYEYSYYLNNEVKELITEWPITINSDIEIIVEKKAIDLPFTDVSKYDWFYDAVQYVYDRGMMSGFGGRFSPEDNMTRSMIVSTLYRLEGSPEVTDKTAETIFSDVASGEWYTDAVNWAYSTGVTVGYPDRMMFGTYDNVTREQLAVFLYRYAETRGYDVSARKDLSEYRGYEQTSEYAIEAMQWATATGLITGSRVEENGEYVYYLLPGGNATRAQFASILMRFCEYYEIK